MDETLHILVEHILQWVAPVIGSLILVQLRLNAGKKNMEASAVEIIQKAQAQLVDEQRDRIQTLHERVDKLEAERENLFTQIRALTTIIEQMKAERIKERESFERQLVELRAQVFALTQERNRLLEDIETLKNHGRPTTDSENTEAATNRPADPVLVDRTDPGQGDDQGQDSEDR